MMDFQPQRGRKGGPTLVEQIVQAFAGAIAQQVLRPGMAIPSVREFARRHDVSTFTVASAYGRLVAQGWLSARAGAGYRVSDTRQASPGTPPANWTPPRLNTAWLLSDIYVDHSIPIKAGCGWLPGEWLNEEGLHQALRHMGRVPALRISGYGQPQGYAPLRESIAAALGLHGLPLEAEQIVLTQGVTHGLDLVIRTLLRPGDVVMVEQPCYANLLQLLRLSGMRVIAVPRQASALDLAALEQAVREHQPRALFINPVLQNPCAGTLTMANAFRLLQAANQHGFWIIEDDISRELQPSSAPLMAALDGGERVIYLGGYSKVISPSVRVGYVVAHRDLARDIARTKMAAGLTSPEIMERVVHQVIGNGRYRGHILRTRERLAQAHDQVAGQLQACGFEMAARPQAGLFLWARQQGPQVAGARALAQAALRDGIWLAPGCYFDAGEADTPWLRFNVAYADQPALWRFLRRAATDQPALTRS